MSSNILNILGVANKEDVITNLLKYALESSQSFRSLFLSELCNVDMIPDQTQNWGKVYTRISTGETGIPDMVIFCRGEKTCELIIIENKLKAEEGFEQTKRYADPACIQAILKILDTGGLSPTPHFVYLTLFADKVPPESKFISKRYIDLLPILDKLPFNDDINTDKLLEDLKHNLARFYEFENVLSSDFLLKKLEGDSILDGPFLYFSNMFTEGHYHPPVGLKCGDAFRDSALGRRYYGITFTKDGWCHGEITQNDDGKWLLKPLFDINIHFEPQFNVVNKIFSVYLHYEINQYRPESWALENINPCHYQAYLLVRAYIAKTIANTKISHYEAGGRSNQIGKATLPISQDTTVKEFLKHFDQFLLTTSTVIDKVLTEARSWSYDLVELVAMIDEIADYCRDNKYQIEKSANSDEYGIYLNDKDGKNVLWFGIWCDCWLSSNQPISIGVHESGADWSRISLDKFRATHKDSATSFDGYTIKSMYSEESIEKLMESCKAIIDAQVATSLG